MLILEDEKRIEEEVGKEGLLPETSPSIHLNPYATARRAL